MAKALQSFTHATGREITKGDKLTLDDPVVISVPHLFDLTGHKPATIRHLVAVEEPES